MKCSAWKLGPSGVVVATLLLASLAFAQAPLAGPPPPPAPAGSPYEPAGVAEAFAGLTSQPGAHTAFSFDRDMLQSLLGQSAVGLNAVSVQNFRYQEPAFYVPEALASLYAAYGAAGWKHLVEANVSPREQATPLKPITDLWLHSAAPRSTTWLCSSGPRGK